MERHRYDLRHDQELFTIAATITNQTSQCHRPGQQLPVLPPHHPTDICPDPVWSDGDQKLWLTDLTVRFETCFVEASERRETRYQDLVLAIEEAGNSTGNPRRLTLEVSLSIRPGFNVPVPDFMVPKLELSSLPLQACKAAIAGLYRYGAPLVALQPNSLMYMLV